MRYYGNDPETGFPYWDYSVCPDCHEQVCVCGPDPDELSLDSEQDYHTALECVDADPDLWEEYLER